MTATKTTKKEESFFQKVDWVDFGSKSLIFIGTALVSGYVSAAGNDLYQRRKVSTFINDPNSNVIPMDKAK